MNLVDRLTGLVEILQAAAHGLAIGLGDREGMRPDAVEDAQIDVLAEGQRGHFADLDILIDANLLMHGAFIAAERHDFAECGRALQKPVRAGIDADGGNPAFGGHKGCFRNPQIGGDIAFAQLGVFRSVCANFRRRRSLFLSHCFVPSLGLTWVTY